MARARRLAQQEAELVAAQPVGAPVGAAGLEQGLAEPLEQRVARAVPERVVVGLEPVEVEEDQRAAAVGLQHGVEVGHQRAAVGQVGEAVGEGLAAARGQQADVLCVGQAGAHPGGQHRQGGERDGRHGDGPHGRRQQQPERQQRRDRRQRHAGPQGARPAARRLPGREGDGRHPEDPARVQQRAWLVRAGGVLVRVQEVGRRHRRQGGAEQRPAAIGPPAHGAERQPDQRQQGQVEHRVGQGHRDDARRAAGGGEDGREDEGGEQRGTGRTGDHAVERTRRAHPVGAGAQQREDAHVLERIAGEVARVRQTRIGRLVELGKPEDADELADGREPEAGTEGQPREPLGTVGRSAREAHDGGEGRHAEVHGIADGHRPAERGQQHVRGERGGQQPQGETMHHGPG